MRYNVGKGEGADTIPLLNLTLRRLLAAVHIRECQDTI